MIPEVFIEKWRKNVKWQSLAMVEQDLIISRALIDLYNNTDIKRKLVFRGGTALNKLFLKPASRYSEDIDLVQINSEPIGETLKSIRSVLDGWLGHPKGKLTQRSAKLFYVYHSYLGRPAKLKIEINTTEHFHVFDLMDLSFEVDSEWFSGVTDIKTYCLDELIGSKLRALYQRRKGRDLFDLWFLLQNKDVNVNRVLEVFQKHGLQTKQQISRAMFEESLIKKAENMEFRSEVENFITSDITWNFEEAYQSVFENFIQKLPGHSWRGRKIDL